MNEEFFAGYFALNVPAGLTIYWLTNNVLTTAQQLYLKKVTKIELPKPTGTVSALSILPQFLKFSGL